jgi:hypothetical protein
MLTTGEIAAQRINNYPKGTKVRLVSFYVEPGGHDDNTIVPPGTIGEVSMVDSTGTIHTRWENGSCLGILLEDKFEVIQDC